MIKLSAAAVLGLVGVVYVRSTLIGVNPLAYLFRYRLFAVREAKGVPLLLIARTPPDGSAPVPVRLVLPGLGVLLPDGEEGPKY